MLAAISISGYIPTSGDITDCTIETFDLENMGIAVGTFFLGATELEIHLVGNFTPPPLDIRRCQKNPGHRRVKLPSTIWSYRVSIGLRKSSTNVTICLAEFQSQFDSLYLSLSSVSILSAFSFFHVYLLPVMANKDV